MSYKVCLLVCLNTTVCNSLSFTMNRRHRSDLSSPEDAVGNSPVTETSTLEELNGDVVKRLVHMEEEETEHNPVAVVTLSEILSNIFFLLGGILYMCVAVWDLVSDTDKYSVNREDVNWTYELLSVLAPLMYLWNAIVDFDAALPWKYLVGSQRRRFYTEQHRWEIVNAITFGTAATMDMIAAVHNAKHRLSYVFDFLGVHIYLLNAAMVLCQRKYSAEKQVGLVRAGDTLFMIGSVIDIAICYLNTPSNSRGNLFMDCCSLISALLWLVDALLYILASVLTVRRSMNTVKETGDEHELPLSVLD